MKPIVTVVWTEPGRVLISTIIAKKIMLGSREGAVSYRVFLNSKNPVVAALKLPENARMTLAVIAAELAIYIGEYEPADGVRLLGGDPLIEQRAGRAGNSIIARALLDYWWPSVLDGKKFYEDEER